MYRSLRTLACAVCCAGLASCAPRLKAEFMPTEALAAGQQEPFPDAAAEVLLRRQRFVLFLGTSEQYTQVQTHEVISIRTEAGRREAEVRIPTFWKGRLVELRARRIDPSGGVVEISPDQIFQSSSSSRSERDSYEMHTFRFPDVKVGSVLEYVYTVEYPWVLNDRTEAAAGHLPVRRYEVELLLHRRIRYSLKVYQSSPEIRRHQEGEYERVSFHLDDIPATVAEEFGPHWTYQAPWWRFRIDQAVWGNWASDPWNTWTAVIEPWAKRVRDEDGTLSEGFAYRLDVEGCPDRGCIVRRALDFMHERTDVTRPGSIHDARPLKAVLEAVNATAAERALLLRRLLTEADVVARVGVATGVLSRMEDKAFPASDNFNVVLLHLPAQPGIEAPLWIDPLCEPCALGEVPSRTLGVQALLLPERKGDEAEFTQVTGTFAPVRRTLRTYEAEVDAAGGVEVLATEVHSGEGVPEQTQGQLRLAADKQRGEAESFARMSSPAARLTSFEPLGCDDRKGTCVRRARFTVDGFCAPDGGGWAIPLSLFADQWAGLPTAGERQTDFFVQMNRNVEEVLRIKLPPGHRVAALPPSRTVETDAFRATVSYARHDGAIEVRRTLEIRRGYYPRKTWAKYRDLFRVLAAVKSEVVHARPALPSEQSETGAGADL